MIEEFHMQKPEDINRLRRKITALSNCKSLCLVRKKGEKIKSSILAAPSKFKSSLIFVIYWIVETRENQSQSEVNLTLLE